MLMLIELGTPDMQNAIGRGCVDNSWSTGYNGVYTGQSNAKWRGIYEFWGNTNERVDGFKTDDNVVGWIFDNKGSGNYVSTGIVMTTSDNNYIANVIDSKGDGFDLSDVFIPSRDEGSATNSTFPNRKRIQANEYLTQSGYWAEKSAAGAFYFFTTPTTTQLYNGSFRIAKYGEVISA